MKTGAIGAAGALTYGLISMRKGDARMSQLMVSVYFDFILKIGMKINEKYLKIY